MKKNLHLCIHRGHGSSCSIILDGKILVSAQEERFSRIKNDAGFPFEALTWALNETGFMPADFQSVAYTTRYFPSIYTKSKHRTNFNLSDYRKYYAQEDKRKNDPSYKAEYYKTLRDERRFNGHKEYFDFSYLKDDTVMVDEKSDEVHFTREQRDYLIRTFGFKDEQICFLDHHTCHAYYAFFGSVIRDKKCIVLTADGGGDGNKQTVWVAEHNKLKLVFGTNENEVAKIYKLTTLILGLRPDEDEYKVMGLAPYAPQSGSERIYKIFEPLLDIEGLGISHKNYPSSIWS